MMEALALGLASGPSCLVSCAPVVVPYLVGEGDRIGRNALILGQMLVGRLAGYLLFGLFVGAVSPPNGEDSALRALVTGVVTLLLASLLIAYGFATPRTRCAAEPGAQLLSRIARRWPDVLPLALGLLTGVSLCPPFVLAMSEASRTGSAAGGALYFFLFFLGTSLYVIPLVFAGALRRRPILQTVGRLAAGVVGFYFLYNGLVMAIGGLRQL